jgi:hypothetical protein
MPFLALVIQFNIPTSWAEDIFPVGLHGLQARSSVRTTPMRPRVSVSGDIPWLIDRSAGLSTSFHLENKTLSGLYTSTQRFGVEGWLWLFLI